MGRSISLLLDAAKSDGQVPRCKGPISGEDILLTDGQRVVGRPKKNLSDVPPQLLSSGEVILKESLKRSFSIIDPKIGSGATLKFCMIRTPLLLSK